MLMHTDRAPRGGHLVWILGACGALFAGAAWDADIPGLVPIAAGQFQMGSPSDEVGRNDDEGPVRTVAVTAFALAPYPVTRAEFANFIEATGYRIDSRCWVWTGERFEQTPDADWRHPGFPQTDRDPVVCVSWNDAEAYTRWLSQRTGEHFRLPSEAEWEYAARAGSTSARYWGELANTACTYADVADESARREIPDGARWTIHPCDDGRAYTAPVGSYRPNAWGLYDMLGNVWQWVEDCYHSSYAAAPHSGAAWVDEHCDKRVLRGGSWAGYPAAVRSAVRLWYRPDIRMNVMGFRVARGTE